MAFDREPTMNPELLAQMESTKRSSIESLRSQLLFNAWSIDKPPGGKRTTVPAVGANKKRKLSLPRGYRSKEYDTLDVWVETDLNALVYEYYNGRMDSTVRAAALHKDQVQRGRMEKAVHGLGEGSGEMDRWTDGGGFGINYVAGLDIVEKRHEYLGPAPMIAGYSNLRNPREEIRLLFFDMFLEDRWCEAETWDIDVEISSNTKGDLEWRMTEI